MTVYTDFAREIRRLILEQSKRANVGHIGSALSIADIMAALYAGPLRAARPDDPDRDRFVLSKGHAALAMYAGMRLNDAITDEQLNTYCGDGSMLGVHPEHVLPGVDFSTGSLGQGFSYGAGSALAARLQGSARRCFVVMSDAEMNEGIIWETAAFAAHHRLANLITIVDMNGQQALGYTRDVLAMQPAADMWAAFGWHVLQADGHDPDQIARTIAELNTTGGPPHVLLAHTTFGKGVSFMENTIKWHYWPMNQDEFEQAMAQVKAV